MSKKKTLYSTLVKNFKKLGYVVEEDSWIELVGYDEPTREYWFDVVIKQTNKVKVVQHYFFRNDKNTIMEISIWKSKIEIVESMAKKLY